MKNYWATTCGTTNPTKTNIQIINSDQINYKINMVYYTTLHIPFRDFKQTCINFATSVQYLLLNLSLLQYVYTAVDILQSKK